MARGGRKFSMAKDDCDQSNHEDIEDILYNFSATYMLHVDLRPSNIVRAPADTQACKVHKCVHQWNIIDFAWSTIDGPGDKSKRVLICRLQQAQWRNRYCPV
ncbi:hypothetical protein DAEQUDRAFT_770526 [Daedalea quercina L-15889]|uniref:Protein kinase domain-containing protein n=1 Tax=Daedalea quercina L-15889 TaxID=1314783 RepID=A0A165KSP6_9APHY|nr:hypothetical protein DAEQUDRAFT_770526 [Daedalea quercina L-15889]